MRLKLQHESSLIILYIYLFFIKLKICIFLFVFHFYYYLIYFFKILSYKKVLWRGHNKLIGAVYDFIYFVYELIFKKKCI